MIEVVLVPKIVAEVAPVAKAEIVLSNISATIPVPGPPGPPGGGISDTDSLPEGAINLYFTDERADARVTKTAVGLSNVTNDAQIPLTQKGAVSGVAELDSNGLVPTSQLPSFVDDVLEYANFAAFPGTGTTGKIYVTLDTNITYRWSGSVYVEISVSLALGTTSSTAHRGDHGATAYNHSQSTGNPHNTTKSDVGLGSVPNLDTTAAVANQHTHSNKTTLDAITEAFTTALKSTYDSAVTWISTNGTNLINHLSNTSNPHSVTKSQVGLSNVDNTSDVNKPISSATQTALNAKQDSLGYTAENSANKSTSVVTDQASATKYPTVKSVYDWVISLGYITVSALTNYLQKNVAITGATKTKVTYDANGLITSGADATTADIADSSNKRYVTDAQLVVIGNTSGTNTGNQTSIVGITGTKAQFDTAVSDGNIMYAGDAPTAHTHTASEITDFSTAVAATAAVTANTAKVTNATHTGDVTGSGALTIAADAVTFPKMQNIATAKLLGRGTAGTGDVEEITLGTNLSFTGTTLNAAGGGGSDNDDFLMVNSFRVLYNY
jgi:hypothetical protein